MAMQTPSGEIAHYIDDDQFGAGQSVDKCGPETVAQFWHSTRPDVDNHYTSADIHAQASSLYVHFIGPDDAADHGGTSNQTLYNMLDFVGFKDRHLALPLDAHIISAWLKEGYAVIVGCAEESVYDIELGTSPYNWDTKGLFHIINLTGVDAQGNWLVRDTANIGPEGVRPGPRHYKTNLALTSATLVASSWMAVPTSATPPNAPAPAPAPKPPVPPTPVTTPQPPATDYKKLAEAAIKAAEAAIMQAMDAIGHLF